MSELIVTCRFCGKKTGYNSEHVCPECLQLHGRGLDGLPTFPPVQLEKTSVDMEASGPLLAGANVSGVGKFAGPQEQASALSEDDEKDVAFMMGL